MIKQLVWVMLGGAMGTALRFIAGRWIAGIHNTHFPWGTFIINVAGCFIIGLVAAIASKENSLDENYRLFLTAGICGGFTTFSAFSLESITLLRDNKLSLFFIYSFGSLLAGFTATYLAIKIIRP